MVVRGYSSTDSLKILQNSTSTQVHYIQNMTLCIGTDVCLVNICFLTQIHPFLFGRCCFGRHSYTPSTLLTLRNFTCFRLPDNYIDRRRIYVVKCWMKSKATCNEICAFFPLGATEETENITRFVLSTESLVYKSTCFSSEGPSAPFPVPAAPSQLSSHTHTHTHTHTQK